MYAAKKGPPAPARGRTGDGDAFAVEDIPRARSVQDLSLPWCERDGRRIRDALPPACPWAHRNPFGVMLDWKNQAYALIDRGTRLGTDETTKGQLLSSREGTCERCEIHAHPIGKYLIAKVLNRLGPAESIALDGLPNTANNVVPSPEHRGAQGAAGASRSPAPAVAETSTATISSRRVYRRGGGR